MNILDIEQFEHIKNYCNSYDNPTALFDGNLVCIYCNTDGFLTKGDKLAIRMLTPLPNPIVKTVKTMVTIEGSVYCAKVSPFWGEFYFCEFLNVNDLVTLAEYTDIYTHLKPMMGSLDRNSSSIWMKSTSLGNYLRGKADFEGVQKVLEFETNMNSVSSDICSIVEYINVLYGEKNCTAIETYRLVKNTVERCNKILKECGRAIDFIADIDDYYIFSCQRHAIISLVNVIQNALLYSPYNTVPILTLTSVLENDTRYVVLRAMNDSVYFVDDKSGEKIERNFAFQRVGLGIPTIKHFVEESNGIFSMEEKNGKVLVEIKIPQYIPTEPILYFESPGISHYKPGVPDAIDMKMNDIVYFFGKKQS